MGELVRLMKGYSVHPVADHCIERILLEFDTLYVSLLLSVDVTDYLRVPPCPNRVTSYLSSI